MGKKKTKQYSAQFKFTVVLEAFSGEKAEGEIARAYGVHPLRCPACHGEMRILASLTDPAVVRPILHYLHIPEHPPPVPPARGPPLTELLAHDPPRGPGARSLTGARPV